MRFACWITKATDTHSEYAILIAFPRQKRLRERVSMLRYQHIACLAAEWSCIANVYTQLTVTAV
jgi:hypothetical protein